MNGIALGIIEADLPQVGKDGFRFDKFGDRFRSHDVIQAIYSVHHGLTDAAGSDIADQRWLHAIDHELLCIIECVPCVVSEGYRALL